ncbi:Protein of unknown function [Litoreibacter albidus]|uniref:DUF3800 domain-containing protein n=1 Tax=Litoreibacter albidus TaxID=670155 RepID=A0A1H2RGD8_9RHOB|nr:Protein of unknown function [Litoreibacter albidus]
MRTSLPKTYILCLDDSGARHPTRKVGRQAEHGYDWFALGGILFDEDKEKMIRQNHRVFCEKWSLEVPLHSSEIRARASNFAFIRTLETREQSRFYEELYCLMRDIPVHGMACVIDRPGYNARYLKKYDEDKRWLLCKSAFNICVERAAKIASTNDAKLRVYIERADKKTDRLIKEYFIEMREQGMPFAKETSKKYAPSSTVDLAHSLYEFRTKAKSSPLMQLADLYLWPLCMGGYNSECRPYKRLSEDEKLVDNMISEAEKNSLGIKYYCFDK